MIEIFFFEAVAKANELEEKGKGILQSDGLHCEKLEQDTHLLRLPGKSSGTGPGETDEDLDLAFPRGDPAGEGDRDMTLFVIAVDQNEQSMKLLKVKQRSGKSGGR